MLEALANTTVDVLDDRWEAAALFTRPLDDLIRPGHPEFPGADGLDRFRSISGQIDGTPFVFRSYRGDPPNTVQLYFARAADRPEPLHDLATLHDLVARTMIAFGIHAADLAWKAGDHVADDQAFMRDLRERQGG